MRVGDRVQLVVNLDMGTWDIPAGSTGTVKSFVGTHVVVDLDPPLYAAPRGMTVEVKPSSIRPAGSTT